MQYVDGKPGYPHWNANGITNQVEGPHWYRSLPHDPEKGVQLSQEDSLRLALLHSSNYQTQLEELYLSALDVTFERFRFDAQSFAGANLTYQQQARVRAGSPSGSSTLNATAASNGTGGAGANVGGGRGVFAQRLTTTGATMVVGLANTIMWQFSGPDSQTAMSLLDFSIVQPLLRGAGRDRIMETLTQAERTLLANVRQMERFRKGFYIQVITGRNAGQGPQRNGLATFDGSANVGNVGGYIGLLQSQQIIRNQENNLAALRDNLSLFEEFYNNGERINKLQVAQTRQALYSAQSRLLSSKIDYQTTLDGFKTTLGLPPQLDVCIEDDMLYRFQLISEDIDDLKAEVLLLRLSRLSPQIDRLRSHISSDVDPDAQKKDDTIVIECADLNNVEKLKKFFDQQESYRRQEEALRNGEPGEELKLEKIPCLPIDAEPTDWTPSLEKKLQGVLQEIETALQIIRHKLVDKEGKEQPLLAEVRADVVEYCQCKTVRKSDLKKLREVLTRLRDPCQPNAEDGGYGGFDEQLFETDRIDADFQRVLAAYLRAKKSFEETASYLEIIRDSIKDIMKQGPDKSGTKDLTLRICDEILFQAPDALLDFYSNTIGLSLVQARARTGCIRLLPVDIDPESAFRIACQNRLDWMNARAALVDAWRLIEFNADDLEANLDLVFAGDIGNVGNNPFRFRDTNSSMRVGLRFDSPITRLQERNSYREALINYQRARRQFYTFRDSIAATLRNEIRNINLNRVNFELQREAILVAVEQVDQVRERLLAPPAAAEGGGGQQLGPTTARDLVSAQNDLLNAQNTFMGLWVNYEVLRRSLDFDMGTLQLSADGFWIDPGPMGSADSTSASTNGQPTPANTGDAIPIEEVPLQGPQPLPPPR